MRRIIALATNPIEGASTRFRIEQWRDCLARAGFAVHLEPFYSSSASRVIYRRRRLLAKGWYLLVGVVRRIRVLLALSKSADMVFVHREAFPFGWPLLFGRLRRFSGTIVYDYDDAMFLPQRRGRGMLEWLERLDTPRRIMAISHLVLAGNPYLAEYARRHSRHVVLLPTSIDTDRFKPAARVERIGRRMVIGWIGSHSTSKYLDRLVPALERVAAEIDVEFYVVGCSRPLDARTLAIVQQPWSLDREVEDFQRCDVGVYPLWDDDWSRGKSGFKAIQFMACGVPVVASPVGVTMEIIKDGENGFLARAKDEWAEKLTTLLSDPVRRRAVGDAARRTIEARYSIRANAPVLTAALRGAIERTKGGNRSGKPIADDVPETRRLA